MSEKVFLTVHDLLLHALPLRTIRCLLKRTQWPLLPFLLSPLLRFVRFSRLIRLYSTTSCRLGKGSGLVNQSSTNPAKCYYWTSTEQWQASRMSILPSHGTLANSPPSLLSGTTCWEDSPVPTDWKACIRSPPLYPAARLSGVLSGSRHSSAPVKMTCEMGLEIENDH